MTAVCSRSTSPDGLLLLGAASGRFRLVRKWSASPSDTNSLANPRKPICPERSKRRNVAIETPLRVAKSLRDLTSGYHEDVDAIINGYAR